MKKKLALLALVILVTLVTATTALASHGTGQGSSAGQQFSTIGGTITAIDNNTITVRTLNDKLAMVQVTISTSFLRWTPTGREPITFGDVEVGDSTNIKGTVDAEGVFFASVVTVDVPLYCQE
jgi:Cu/Ag efflux protein CusF